MSGGVPVAGRYGTPSAVGVDDMQRPDLVDDIGGIVGHGAPFARVESGGVMVRLETCNGKLVEIVEGRARTTAYGVGIATLDLSRRLCQQREDARTYPYKGGRVEAVRIHLRDNGPSTTKQIADATGIRRRQVSESLQCLKRKGLTDFTESSDYHRARICVWRLKGGA